MTAIDTHTQAPVADQSIVDRLLAGDRSMNLLVNTGRPGRQPWIPEIGEAIMRLSGKGMSDQQIVDKLPFLDLTPDVVRQRKCRWRKAQRRAAGGGVMTLRARIRRALSAERAAACSTDPLVRWVREVRRQASDEGLLTRAELKLLERLATPAELAALTPSPNQTGVTL